MPFRSESELFPASEKLPECVLNAYQQHEGNRSGEDKPSPLRKYISPFCRVVPR